MVYLKVNVKCFRCRKEVEKTQAREMASITKEPRYECFACFNKNKTQPWGFGDKMKYKKEFYCLRCKYKFKRRGNLCPYCNKEDSVIRGNITVHDLL